MYYLECPCGTRPSVRLSQAGTTIQCPQCGAALSVPSSSDLRRLAGDQHPYLDALQRIAKALQQGAPPFHGICQQCGNRAASVQVPVTFQFLVKREVSDHEGLGPGFSPIKGPSLDLVVGAAREYWQTSRFPLLFCEICHREFRRGWNRATLLHAAKGGVALMFLVPLILFLMLFGLLIPFISIPAMILVIVMAFRYYMRKKAHPFLLGTLERLPLVCEAIAVEDEYRIQAGSPARFVPVAKWDGAH
jgi:hypothetical protein